MPILGAVLTLRGGPEDWAETSRALAQDPALTLGQPTGPRLPVVLDTPDRAADRAAWRRVSHHPGVAHADLISADFSDLIDSDTLEGPCNAANS